MPALSPSKLHWLFFGVCAPLRMGLVVLAASAYVERECRYTCKVLGGIVFLFVFFAFLTQFFGRRSGFFNKKQRPAWWNLLRPFHALAYGVAGVLLWAEVKKWWLVLCADIFVGVVAFIFNSCRRRTPTHYIKFPRASDEASVHHVN